MSVQLVLCAWLALGACNDGDDDGLAAGDDGNDDAPGDMNVAREGGQAADAVVDALCDLFDDCCRASSTQSGGRARCESSFEDAPLFAALHAGTAVVVEPAFGTCLAALRRQAETCGRPLADTSSCADAFMGAQGEGERCEEAIECTRGETVVLCIKTGDPAGPEPQFGECHALTHAGPGEPCQFSWQTRLNANFIRPEAAAPLLGYCDRADGLRCDASRTCVPLRAAGEACRSHNECEQELFCDQTCRPPLPEGAACSEQTVCETGLVCLEGRCAVFSFEDGVTCGSATNALPPVL